MCRKNVTKHHNQCNLKNDKLHEDGDFRTFLRHIINKKVNI